MRRRADHPTVVTDAERSQEDQLRVRERRYVLMMSVRVLSLVVAAILVTVRPPLLWLWLVVCAAGMIFLPWVAVILANDRLPRGSRLRRAPRPRPAGRELPSAREVDAPPEPAPDRGPDREPGIVTEP